MPLPSPWTRAFYRECYPDPVTNKQRDEIERVNEALQAVAACFDGLEGDSHDLMEAREKIRDARYAAIRHIRR